MVVSPEKNRTVDLRPVSLTSVVYRVWGGVGLPHLMRWQESWLPDTLRGFRQGSGADDLYTAIACEVEHALATGEKLCGVSFCYKQAFDLVPHQILFGLLEELGLIDDIPTVKELIDRIMSEAEALITQRLASIQAANRLDDHRPVKRLAETPVEQLQEEAQSLLDTLHVSLNV